MRDRTCEYLDCLLQKAREKVRARDALRKKLQEYKERNRILPKAPDKPTTLSVSAAVLGNYVESRVCAYRYSKECEECGNEVYLCGVNCKLCGLWACTVCIESYEGVSACGECCLLLSRPERRREARAEEVAGKWFALLKETLQRPCSESVQELARLYQGENSVENQVRKNLITRMKIAVCDWHAYKAREEKYFLLVQQLDYLEAEKARKRENSGVLERAIEEILWEIGRESK
ncbi:uncharacterized protein NEMAJ01_0749 [Nematocida major]|uniref:uncharacterized protein n=1 Tax=Nematocida major TaxID=1912982 RepID=UPI002008CEDD|nr:uncharacterized protein NEMAJ01_0749 [Nematocida major]KAH9385853.1 hypothetical protein NEMAJ01_0749 [Nematocida major]